MMANLDGTNPQAVVTRQDFPHGVAVDATHLYWTNAAEDDSTINRANLDGTSPRPIVPGQDSASGVAVGF
jgi:DNA-binding beta-propeller fold protein YncE